MNATFRIIVLCLLTTCLLSSAPSHAQGENQLAKLDHQPKYIVIVEKKNGETAKGLLHAVTKESVDIINFRDSAVHILIPSEDVTAIRYRKLRKMLKYGFAGFGIGAVVGVVVGAITYEAHPCGFATCVEKGIDPVSAGMIGGIAGAAIGAGLGSKFTRIDLQGDPKKYEAAITFFEKPR